MGRLELRLSEAEQASWREHAEDVGESLSEFVRSCVRARVEGVRTPESVLVTMRSELEAVRTENAELRGAVSDAEARLRQAQERGQATPARSPQGALRRYVCSKCKRLSARPRCPDHPEARQQPI